MVKLNSIEVSDVVNYLNMIDDKSVDLILTDPPYGISIDDWDVFKNEDEYFNFMYTWLELAINKIKDDGSIYLFNNNYNSAHILLFLKDKGLFFQNWITWYKKDGFTSLKRKFNRNQETLLFFTKDKKNYIFNYDDVRVPYESTNRIEAAKKKGILKNGKRWFPNPNGKLCGDVWEYSSEKNRNRINGKLKKQFHATQKPVEMIERIIKASTNEGDLVLDPFMGSGTTALAAKNLNRNFIGCDLNPDYVEFSLKRLE
jgi:site-specific DNA-methyltransferase (adenine-specific)